jgi:cobyrinic acid a,c-diamide synthase
VAEVVEKYLDIDGIFEAAQTAGSLDIPEQPPEVLVTGRKDGGPSPRIGVFLDAAFQFYYPENLEALSAAGGEIVEISPLLDPKLPPVDALYLGGGFPETLAAGLSGNLPFLSSVKEAADEGLPIYAECGGAVYLGQRLHYDGGIFELAGVLPIEFGFQAKPRGHGYTVLEAIRENPFYEVGQTLRGHEFHYTFMLPLENEDLGAREFAFRVHRGYGFDGQHDGLIWGNVLASYAHIHALGMAGWAPSLIREAERFRASFREEAAP